MDPFSAFAGRNRQPPRYSVSTDEAAHGAQEAAARQQRLADMREALGMVAAAVVEPTGTSAATKPSPPSPPIANADADYSLLEPPWKKFSMDDFFNRRPVDDDDAGREASFDVGILLEPHKPQQPPRPGEGAPTPTVATTGMTPAPPRVEALTPARIEAPPPPPVEAPVAVVPPSRPAGPVVGRPHPAHPFLSARPPPPLPPYRHSPYGPVGLSHGAGPRLMSPYLLASVEQASPAVAGPPRMTRTSSGTTTTSTATTARRITSAASSCPPSTATPMTSRAPSARVDPFRMLREQATQLERLRREKAVMAQELSQYRSIMGEWTVCNPRTGMTKEMAITRETGALRTKVSDQDKELQKLRRELAAARAGPPRTVAPGTAPAPGHAGAGEPARSQVRYAGPGFAPTGAHTAAPIVDFTTCPPKAQATKRKRSFLEAAEAKGYEWLGEANHMRPKRQRPMPYEPPPKEPAPVIVLSDDEDDAGCDLGRAIRTELEGGADRDQERAISAELEVGADDDLERAIRAELEARPEDD
ncbi:MAG: hypothetical protein M1832_005590 [Thelocarpon impressellum]|nr:MAG: hypothetical protein M1832_005590 [Thelocarpon impressellum]